MNFSLIIPTKDRKDILSKSLQKIATVKNPANLQIIIVNDSELPLLVEKEKFPGNIEIVRNPGKGVASARNYGASKALHDWLIYMDDDMWVQPETFEKLLPVIQNNEGKCFNINWVFPPELANLRKQLPFLRYLHKYGFDSLKGWSNDPDWSDDAIFKVNGITSQFLVIHKALFKKLGGYNESFPFAGFEDHDLSKRMKTAGVEIYLDPTNIIFHNEEDRIHVENWLERKKRGAITRRVAVNMGYEDLRLQYSIAKSIVNRFVFSSKKYLLSVLSKWPNTSKLDPFYFTLINRLLGAYSFAGYKQSNPKKN